MYSAESRIIKARQYFDERDERIQISSLTCIFTGEHSQHVIEYVDQVWRCDCEEFARTHVCAHVMAMEKVLGAGVMPATFQTAATPDASRI